VYYELERLDVFEPKRVVSVIENPKGEKPMSIEAYEQGRAVS
jgi:hypothetical protein